MAAASGYNSSQSQFIASHTNHSASNGPTAPLIDGIDVDQIIVPEVIFLSLFWSIIVQICPYSHNLGTDRFWIEILKSLANKDLL